MNGRPLASAVDGSFTFRPGRFYRLVCIVNGPTYLEDVDALLYALGFAPVASSDPDAWQHEMPPDWPDERPLPFVAANETLVRISAGAGAVRHAICIGHNAPILDAAGNAPATLTVARAWDFGLAPPVEAIAGAAPTAAPKASKASPSVALFAAGGLAAVGLWHYVAERKRLKRDEARLHSAEAKAEREQVASEVNRLIRRGYEPRESRRAIGELETEEEAEIILLGATEP